MDRIGSASADRVRDLTAGKLTSKLSDGVADGRGRQYPTQTGHRRCQIGRPIPDIRAVERWQSSFDPDVDANFA